MTGPDQVQARNAALDMLEERTAKRLTLEFPVPCTIVPGVGYVRAFDDTAFRYCKKCDPPPEVFVCPLCDWGTEDRWRFKLHTDLNLKWCAERGARKVRAWASKT